MNISLNVLNLLLYTLLPWTLDVTHFSDCNSSLLKTLSATYDTDNSMVTFHRYTYNRVNRFLLFFLLYGWCQDSTREVFLQISNKYSFFFTIFSSFLREKNPENSQKLKGLPHWKVNYNVFKVVIPKTLYTNAHLIIYTSLISTTNFQKRFVHSLAHYQMLKLYYIYKFDMMYK